MSPSCLSTVGWLFFSQVCFGDSYGFWMCVSRSSGASKAVSEKSKTPSLELLRRGVKLTHYSSGSLLKPRSLARSPHILSGADARRTHGGSRCKVGVRHRRKECENESRLSRMGHVLDVSIWFRMDLGRRSRSLHSIWHPEFRREASAQDPNLRC